MTLEKSISPAKSIKNQIAQEDKNLLEKMED